AEDERNMLRMGGACHDGVAVIRHQRAAAHRGDAEGCSVALAKQLDLLAAVGDADEDPGLEAPGVELRAIGAQRGLAFGAMGDVAVDGAWQARLGQAVEVIEVEGVLQDTHATRLTILPAPPAARSDRRCGAPTPGW